MFINTKEKSPDIQTEVVTGFLGGGNSFQDQTVIRDSELTKFKNIILSVDGIEPRPGTLNLVGTGSDSKVYGAFGFYKSDGTREFLRLSGARLKKYTSSNWSQVAATAFTNVNTNFIQVRDKVWVFNGSDNLSYYDGSTITVYSAVNTPTSLAVTAKGTPASTAYSYRVSGFNATGETLACTAVAIANGAATLNTTNYNELNWDDMAGAVGYNVYGRKATGLGETLLATVYVSAYNDTGVDDPSETILPPEGDSTAGLKCKYACFAISRIFAAGDPANPSRLYWGGVGTNVGNFSGAPEGGGYADVFKNDGSEIRGIIPFQGGVIVGKDNAIYKFSFNATSNAPQLEEITRSFGVISHRSMMAVENDIIFAAKKDGRVAFYSLGNQENFSSAVLRTNELSIKIATELEDVNLTYIQNSAAFYYYNIYGCAVPCTGSTVNNRIWCLDTRFGAWVQWDDLTPNCFVTYTDTDGSQKLYYGDESTGYMVEMFKDERNDNNVAIDVEFATKAFSQKRFDVIKKYSNSTFQFKGVNKNSAISGDIILDGVLVEKSFTVKTQTAGGSGIGAMLLGAFLPGESKGGVSAATDISSDQVVQVSMSKKARTIKYEFRSRSVNLRYKFLSLAHRYQVLDNKRLPQSSIVY